jgi:Cu2+-exporting ATPase
VHGLLEQHGLQRFYQLGGSARGAVGGVPQPGLTDWLPELEARCTGDTVRIAVDVQGIRCAACVWLLQELWRRQPGALHIDVDPSLGRLQLCYQRGSGAAGYLCTIAAFGYRTAPARKTAPADTGLLVRLGICAALAMNAMIVGFAQYFGLAAETGTLPEVFRWLALGFGTASVAVGGPVFFRSALLALHNRVVHMDLPIALGIALAWIGSVAGQLSGSPGYFDTLSVFIALMLLGRFLQQRALQRNRDLVLADDGAEHLRARLLREHSVVTVPVTQVVAGDELLLAPGDLLPVRARTGEQPVPFSLDWINGESEPRLFAPGDEVPAGSFLAGSSAVRVRASAGYLDSGLAELLQAAPPDLEGTRGRVTFWDRLNRWYAVAVIALAAAGAGLWLCLEPARALPVAVAVLVVTCPCALGIAVPLAFHLSLSLLRRRGVFVRSRALLDKMGRVRKVVFDKTGTVTMGGLRASCTLAPPAAVMDVLGTLAASSSHPASRAVLQEIEGRFRFRSELEPREVPGGGVLADSDGAEYRFGSPAFAGVPATAARESVLVRDGEVLAAFALAEDFRAGAAAEIATLRARGLEVHLMSGDQRDRVAVAAARLGIAPELAHGGMSPQDKARAIAHIDDADTLMVGDGLNDAPAFAAAFCAGTPALDRPVLPARSDFFYAGAQSGAVLALLEVSELLHATVRTSLRRALCYNATVVGLSLAGLMTPLLCAVLMPLSSLGLVLHTSLRFHRARRAS